MPRPPSATDAFWRDRVIPCSNGHGYMILDNAGRTRPVSCELEANHEGDHKHWIVTWPQAKFIDVTVVDDQVRQLMEVIPILTDPKHRAMTIPQMLEFLTNVFTDDYELVRIDPAKVLEETIALKRELSSGRPGVHDGDVHPVHEIDGVAGQE